MCELCDKINELATRSIEQHLGGNNQFLAEVEEKTENVILKILHSEGDHMSLLHAKVGLMLSMLPVGIFSHMLYRIVAELDPDQEKVPEILSRMQVQEVMDPELPGMDALTAALKETAPRMVAQEKGVLLKHLLAQAMGEAVDNMRDKLNLTTAKGKQGNIHVKADLDEYPHLYVGQLVPNTPFTSEEQTALHGTAQELSEIFLERSNQGAKGDMTCKIQENLFELQFTVNGENSDS